MIRLFMQQLVITSVFLLLPVYLFAAENSDLPSSISAAKASIEDTAVKVGNYPQALSEIEKARIAEKKASVAYENGKQWMGLRGLKPEAEQEVRHHLKMVEMAITLANSRAAKGRNEEEVARLDNQLATLKARVKLLEDRKAEEDRMRQALQKSEAAAKDLATVKADSSRLSTQVNQLTADNKKLQSQVDALTAEKTALVSQLETLRKAAVQPAPAPVAPAAAN